MHTESNRRVEELRSRLGDINSQSQAIAEKASREGRDLTAREHQQVAENFTEFQKVEADLARAEVDAMDAALSAPQPRIAQPVGPWSSAPNPTAGGRTPPALRPQIEALGRFVKTGQLSQIADAMTLTPAEGGYGVSPQLDPVLQVIYANQSGLIRAGAKIVQRGINDSYSQPIATGLPAVGWVAEGGARTATDSPVFTLVQPRAAASTQTSAPRAGSSRTGHTVSSAPGFSTRSVGLRARRLGSSWSSATGPTSRPGSRR